jgi:A/G-specific adenine glycosylase
MARHLNGRLANGSVRRRGKASRFRRALLGWYDAHKRDLPWRGEKDPYKIWVSEIMLQQTRVAVVLDRYARFLKRFPTVQVLARARVTSVVAEWSGLGYYRRARALHAAARIVVRQHGGRLPRSAAALTLLPGVGRYTSAAIASIAFGEALPVVDGNVERVLQRFCAESSLRYLEHYYERAAELLDPRRPGDFNQAMMELGATVCLPFAPLCSECPLARLCRGRRQFSGSRKLPPDERPRPAPPRRKLRAGYRVLLHEGQVCLVQRDRSAALMPSMWELPEGGSKVARSAQQLRLRHSITNTDFEILAHLEPQKEKPKIQEIAARWVPLARVNRLPLTGLTRKILQRFSLVE